MLNLSRTSSYGDEPRKRHYGTWAIVVIVLLAGFFVFLGPLIPEDSKHRQTDADKKKEKADSAENSAAISALAAAPDVSFVKAPADMPDVEDGSLSRCHTAHVGRWRA